MFIYSRIRDTFIRDTLKYTIGSVGIYTMPTLIRMRGLSVSVLTFPKDVKHTFEQLNWMKDLNESQPHQP